MSEREVKVWGGIGEKKSNNNTQFYFQNRIYDSNGISLALTNFKSDYWIVIWDNKDCRDCIYFKDGECQFGELSDETWDK